MRETINHIVFGWYPYLCLIVFLVGSWLRFDREQYTWRSGSSQLLRRRQLMWGSNLFHIGILVIFLGHFVGLLTPIRMFDALGISHTFKQWMAIVLGGVAGIMCFVGITLLVHRRLFDTRIRKTSSFGDIAILLLLYAQLILGLATIPVSLGHLDGHEMVKFMTWAQGILTLQPGVSALVADANPIFKLHLVPRHDDLPRLPVHPPGARVERADLVSRPPRLPGGADDQPCAASARAHRGCAAAVVIHAAAGGRRAAGAGGVGRMTCALHAPNLPQPKLVSVNGTVIARAAIAREVQHHPASKPVEAWRPAARALVVRELLLQEAHRLGSPAEPRSRRRWPPRNRGGGAHPRGSRTSEVTTPEPMSRPAGATTSRIARRSAPPALRGGAYPVRRPPRSAGSIRAARAIAAAVLAELAQAPHRFGEFARLHSACPSAAHGGNLGQIGAGQTTPEFEQALVALAPGAISRQPVESRYGFHIIRLDRKIEGRELPFELVAGRIADYLREAVTRRAAAQYLARLVSRADIRGVALADAAAHRVN